MTNCDFMADITFVFLFFRIIFYAMYFFKVLNFFVILILSSPLTHKAYVICVIVDART